MMGSRGRKRRRLDGTIADGRALAFQPRTVPPVDASDVETGWRLLHKHFDEARDDMSDSELEDIREAMLADFMKCYPNIETAHAVLQRANFLDRFVETIHRFSKLLLTPDGAEPSFVAYQTAGEIETYQGEDRFNTDQFLHNTNLLIADQ